MLLTITYCSGMGVARGCNKAVREILLKALTLQLITHVIGDFSSGYSGKLEIVKVKTIDPHNPANAPCKDIDINQLLFITIFFSFFLFSYYHIYL